MNPQSGQFLPVLSADGEITMSSLEIAELTGKQHKNVVADCRKLKRFYTETYSAEISAQHIKSTTYKDESGKNTICFMLSKQASIDLVTGYSLPHRHAVNARWLELENQEQQAAIPQDLPTALRLAADLAEENARITDERDHAIATKAHISDKKTATAMNTASQASKRAKKLEKQLAESRTELDESKEFASIKRMETNHGGKYKWRELKSIPMRTGCR